MAASRTKRAKPSVGPEEVEAALVGWRERLLAEGAVKLSALTPRASKATLIARLAAEGFQLTTTWVRRALDDQVREALVHGATVTRKSLTGLVRGASATELQKALATLEVRGEVHRVLRGKDEAFTGTTTAVLTPRALKALSVVVAELSKALAAAGKKKGATLLASDVEETLARAQRALNQDVPHGASQESTPMSVPKAASDEQDLAPVLAALDATRDERTGLSFVPALMARLLPQMPVAVAHEVLLTAARKEVIELRPEGGLGRLSNEELRLCPPGPGGTRLSWARRLADGASG
jgi:hypothetical protein